MFYKWEVRLNNELILYRGDSIHEANQQIRLWRDTHHWTFYDAWREKHALVMEYRDYKGTSFFIRIMHFD